MDVLIDKLSSGQIVAVIAIVSGAVVALAMIVAISKYQFQVAADDAALKRERQQAELALRERLIERREATDDRAGVEELLALGATTGPAPDDLDAELAGRFGQLDADAADIERTLGLVLALDAAHKRKIVAVMDGLIANDAAAEAILAAVRPLCAAAPARTMPVTA